MIYQGFEIDREGSVQPNPDGATRYSLIESNELQNSLAYTPNAGEVELMDAANLMERGDYSGAIRRITTAIEVVTEVVLRKELLKSDSDAVVEDRLKASQSDFPGRFRQYQRLSGRTISEAHQATIDELRALRHSVVHRGKQIAFTERWSAQKLVDTGRWVFNWIENDPERSQLREKKVAFRALGRNLGAFPGELTPEGPVVHPFRHPDPGS